MSLEIESLKVEIEKLTRDYQEKLQEATTVFQNELLLTQVRLSLQKFHRMPGNINF